MDLANLDTATRQLMRDEINRDIANDALYMSPRLSERGREDYPALLLEGADRGDALSLAAALSVGGRLEAQETATRSGRVISKRVPVDAHHTLAEGEFNRFYVRAVCLRAMKDGTREVIIYRAKAVGHPRPESEARIGIHLDAGHLLADLRQSIGVDTALGVPAGPNSGLSVRLLSPGVPADDAERESPPGA